jgi:hypothetical protein
MRGNIGYLTVGNYIYRQPGVFTDIKIGNFFDGSWDVGINKDNTIETDRGQYDGNELPMMLKITLSFKPIHTFLPRKAKNDASPSVPFIGRDTSAYPYPKGNGTSGTSGSTNV